MRTTRQRTMAIAAIILVMAIAGCARDDDDEWPAGPAAPFHHEAVITWAEFQIIHDVLLDVRFEITPAITMQPSRQYQATATVSGRQWQYRIRTEPGSQDTVTALDVWNGLCPREGDTLRFEEAKQ